MLMHDRPVVWLPGRIYEQFFAEADRFYDLETGGTLMGYRYDTITVVVTVAIDAGPAAHRARHNFEPDQEWQVSEIAKHYANSGRRETYLGDWHTHPDAKIGRLSWTDCRVLRHIINSPGARAPTPIMMVLHATKGEWQATTWMAALKPRPIIWSKLLVSEAELRLY